MIFGERTYFGAKDAIVIVATICFEKLLNELKLFKQKAQKVKAYRQI